MKRSWRMAALASLPWLAEAQPYTQLSGLVRDSFEHSVPEAQVTAVNEDNGFRRISRTGLDGAYFIGSLQPGSYKITVRKEGFRPVVRFGVQLPVAQPARLDFSLSVGGQYEIITVESGPPMLNAENGAVGTLVGREWVDRIPLNGRGLSSLLELAPGVVTTPATRGESGQFTVNGSRPNSHYFTLDGVSVNSGVSGGGQPAHSIGGSLPGLSAFGSLHSLVSVEALEEFRLQTSSTVAEFGRLPGAQVSLSSRAGTNEFHGSLFHYLRDASLDANDWFSNRAGLGRPSSHLRDSGGTLAGPAWRNRTFFFASFEQVRMKQPFLWRTASPTLEAREEAPAWSRPLLDLFAPPNGPSLGPGLGEWIGRRSRPSYLDTGSLRLDHALTSGIHLFARHNIAPSGSEFGGTQFTRLRLRSRQTTVGVTARFSPGIVHEGRFSYSLASGRSLWLQESNRTVPCGLHSVAAEFQPALPCNTFLRFAIGGLGQVLSGREADAQQQQWNAIDTVTVNAGSHRFQLGFDFRRLTPARTSSVASFATIADSLADYLARVSVWSIASTQPVLTSRLDEWSIFAQDTWRISPRLTLTYGLRWELNPPPYSSDAVPGLSRPTGPLSSSEDLPLWRIRYNNYAPRIGAAYSLGSQGRTVIRGGLGLFLDSSLSVATDLVSGGPFQLWQSGIPAPEGGSARSLFSFGFDPNLRLPMVRQWNGAIEHAVTGEDVVSASYLGSRGSRLLRREVAGNGLVQVVLATNHGDSDYHGLHLQYRRRMAGRWQTLVSYAWSHSIDTASTDGALHWVGRGIPARADRGRSDFDTRHVFTAAFHAETGVVRGWASAVASRWSLDGIFRARTGFPVDVLSSEQAMGVNFANVFRPDLVPGQPLWIRGGGFAGGRKLNPYAFEPRGRLEQGNLGRNSIPGFGMSQLDFALRREFPLRERHAIGLRVELFNAFNHANFADPVRYRNSPLFGEPASMLNLMLGSGSPATGLAPMLQIGGPRSVQVVLRWRF